MLSQQNPLDFHGGAAETMLASKVTSNRLNSPKATMMRMTILIFPHPRVSLYIECAMILQGD